MPVTITKVHSEKTDDGYEVTVEINTEFGPITLSIPSEEKDSVRARNDAQRKIFQIGADIARSCEEPLGKLQKI